jgi:hypothetical protein
MGPSSEQAVAASEQLDAKLTGANHLHVMIDYPKGKTLYDPDVLKVIGGVHFIVETQSGVGNGRSRRCAAGSPRRKRTHPSGSRNMSRSYPTI